MKHMPWLLLVRFGRAEGGATAIEYALIAGAMALALVAAVPQVGTAVGAIFAALTAGF
jgi:pilus assembly protein Flp/PilA